MNSRRLRAHDLFANFLNGTVPSTIQDNQEEFAFFKTAHMAMCWALGHKTQDAAVFAKMMAELQQDCRDAGYILPHQTTPHDN